MQTYTRWLPLTLTVIAIGIYLILPVKPALIGDKGLASNLLTLVSTLPGFYFAGLAAVATFGNTTMDHEMPAPAPEVDMRVAGKTATVKLTRRLFLSYLFSYLVILSFGLCFSLVTINALSGSIEALQEYIVCSTGMTWPWFVFKALVGIPLTFAFASMVVTTLHGVFFLTEKIHQP
ncbi:MAG: hypothetical protein MK313_10400 [Oceanibaculum sp.]|nr:hypothetical protein [Oceanibaculum sp.]